MAHPRAQVRDDENNFAVASPRTAFVQAVAKKRGRSHARAERAATRLQAEVEAEQLEAEADKWAPGGAAMLSLARSFHDSDADERLARAISPARVRLRCPAGHTLMCKAADDPLCCDYLGCGAQISASQEHLACAACDYDVCSVCAE